MFSFKKSPWSMTNGQIFYQNFQFDQWILTKSLRKQKIINSWNFQERKFSNYSPYLLKLISLQIHALKFDWKVHIISPIMEPIHYVCHFCYFKQLTFSISKTSRIAHICKIYKIWIVNVLKVSVRTYQIYEMCFSKLFVQYATLHFIFDCKFEFVIM